MISKVYKIDSVAGLLNYLMVAGVWETRRILQRLSKLDGEHLLQEQHKRRLRYIRNITNDKALICRIDKILEADVVKGATTYRVMEWLDRKHFVFKFMTF